MATHSSVLAWRIPGTGGAWWAAVYGVAQSQTRLKQLSSSSSSMLNAVVPGGAVVKNVPANLRGRRDTGLIPGSGRFSGGGNGNPLQYSCLENSMDRGVWQTTVHEITRVRQDLATKPPALLTNWGFPGGSDSKVSACSGRPRFDPWVRKMPWRREWLPTPVFFPGESHGWRSLLGYSPRCRK